MTKPWLTIVGVLPSGALAPTAPPDALYTDAVFGAPRLLEAAGVRAEAQRPWPEKFADGLTALLARAPAPTTVLASGDPMHHGVGATLAARLPANDFAVHPAPSAFSLAAATLRWPLADTLSVSLHNRPAEDILTHAAPGRRIIALTRDGDAPAAIAAAITGAGYGGSTMMVLEALGGPDAATHTATADTLTGPFHPLNVVAIACERPRPVSVDTLTHDGCVTRDEVRALTIAALAPPGHLWDIGAGSGAVAIDWIRAGGSATLVERDADRANAIRENLSATKTSPRATLEEGNAGDILPRLPDTPDAIFMGGAVGDETLFAALKARLAPGGRMVTNAVTLEAEAATIARHAELGGTLTRIALSHAGAVGGLTMLRPAQPVLQWRWIAP